MDFLKSILNSFDPSQNGLSNELSNSFDPNKNGSVTKLSSDSTLTSIKQLLNNSNSNIFKSFQNTNNLNGLVSQIPTDLSPQNINNTITTSINPKETVKTIINDPNLNKIIAPVQPIIEPVIQKM